MAGAADLFKAVMGKVGSGARAAGRGAKGAGKYMYDRATPRNLAEVATGLPLDKKFWKDRPGFASLIGAGGVAGSSLLGKEVYDSVKTRNAWESRMREEGRYEQYVWLAQRAEEEKFRRLQRDMATNAARLASANPELYNRVLAGRRLPRGAVVIGGAPRTDLLEELAYRMASGEYKPSQPTDLAADIEAFSS